MTVVNESSIIAMPAENSVDAGYSAAIDEVMSDIIATEPDDVLEPSFIDEQIERQINAWFVAYRT